MYRSKNRDYVLDLFSATATIVSSSLVILIVFYLMRESFVFLKDNSVLHFLSDPSWAPTESSYNILPMVVGTLLASLGCVLIAAPLGLLAAVYIYFYCPIFLKGFLKKVFELSLAIPSVVYGLWGLTVIVPVINQYKAPGTSLFAGIAILAMMVFPILVLTLLDEFKSLSDSFKDSADSLNLSRFTFIFRIILPQAKRLVLITTTLQLGRALGETMAILMVCGNVIQYPSSLFAPIRTLTSNIALEMAYASSTHKAALFSTGLLLMIILCLLFSAVSFGKREHAIEN